jgi:ribonuclease BN (tRNA processing enzyme)
MLLTCLGSGTAALEPDRVCSGYLLETSGLRLLLDCGGGVVHSMARLGVDWQTPTHLVLTHFHNDHIGDVPLLFFAWKWGMRPPRTEPVIVIGPSGTRQLLRRMADIFGDHLSEPHFPLVVEEIEAGGERRLNDAVRLRAFKTPHTPESLAYRIDADSGSFCYTGDTGPSTDLGVFARAVDALLVECSLPDGEAIAMHLTPSQVAALARVAQPRRLLVTHVYPQLHRSHVPALVLAAGSPVHAEMLQDGARLEISPPRP